MCTNIANLIRKRETFLLSLPDQSYYSIQSRSQCKNKSFTPKLTNFPFCLPLQVSATDPDCGVNAMVNYTIGDGFKRFKEFEIRPVTGDICISGRLDHETRAVYEFPVVATDRGE